MSDRVRVVRLIEYDYPNLAAAEQDMRNWTITAPLTAPFIMRSSHIGPYPTTDRIPTEDK